MTPASNAFHATTDPDLLTRLREMLDSSARADIAVGYIFMSVFEAVADSLSHQNKVRILAGRANRPLLELVALGLQQSEALRARLEADGWCSDGNAMPSPGKRWKALLPVSMVPRNRATVAE